MTQTDLFGEPGVAPAQMEVARQVREQEQELSRVLRGEVGEAVREFCRQRGKHLKTGQVFFHMKDLQAFVASRAPSAPGSPDRILRLLRQEGVLNYRIESRSKSLYELLFI